MALFGMMHYREENLALVDTMKDLFRNWGDQIASQDGDGLLVSMWYVTFNDVALIQALRRV